MNNNNKLLYDYAYRILNKNKNLEILLSNVFLAPEQMVLLR